MGYLFNRIDEAARADLRFLNEQNALRFEARLEQLRAELRGDIEKLGARIDSMEQRFDARFASFAVQQKLDLEKAIHGQTRSMVAMWAIVIASQIGLWLR